MIVARPQLPINPNEREDHFEQRLKRHRLWPQEGVPGPRLERLLFAAFKMQSEHAEEPICSPDQKEAARQQVAFESSVSRMPNCAGS